MRNTGTLLNRVSCVGLLIFATTAASLTGCGAPEARFHANLVYAHMQGRKNAKTVKVGDAGETRTEPSRLTPEQSADIANVLTAMFGTPDDPALPVLADAEVGAVVDLQRVKMSAGRVSSDKSGKGAGLYREHCVHCHGITGDGLGPTAAFLNPYPRDYRKGTFKFKSTPRGSRPTHDDLTRVLMEGIAGTAMPSFKVLDADEVDSLVHYVKYLAIRGELERQLVDETVYELSSDEEGAAPERLVPDSKLKQANPEAYEAKLARLREMAAQVVQKWKDAEGEATAIAARPAGWQESEAMKQSIARGRDLFYGPVANCIKCHGDSALGDGQLTDYDDWTKELDPAAPDAVSEYVKLGALQPRNIRPRNLRVGIFRGGMRPIDIYWRLRNGIDGTPMPAVPYKEAGDPNPKALSDEDIWCLVDYVRSLPFEAYTRADKQQPTNVRERL